jgi:hypothetical protein
MRSTTELGKVTSSAIQLARDRVQAIRHLHHSLAQDCPVAEEVVETGDDRRFAARPAAVSQGAGDDLRHGGGGRMEV